VADVDDLLEAGKINVVLDRNGRMSWWLDPCVDLGGYSPEWVWMNRGSDGKERVKELPQSGFTEY
jgi:hypothetical protein